MPDLRPTIPALQSARRPIFHDAAGPGVRLEARVEEHVVADAGVAPICRFAVHTAASSGITGYSEAAWSHVACWNAPFVGLSLRRYTVLPGPRRPPAAIT